jgi:very-short-patch-repair endonuclease
MMMIQEVKEPPHPFGAVSNSPSLEGWQAQPDGVVKFTNEARNSFMRDTKKYMSLPYNPALKERAKALRCAGNLAEVLLWNQLKRKQFLGLDFDRQKIIGNYIVDFYCAEKSVVIEVDGSSHDDKAEYDALRDAFLMGLDLMVIHLRDHPALTTEETTPPLWGTPPREGNSDPNSLPSEGWQAQPDGVVKSRVGGGL